MGSLHRERDYVRIKDCTLIKLKLPQLPPSGVELESSIEVVFPLTPTIPCQYGNRAEVGGITMRIKDLP
ncbi:hypothetical protein [Paenibacillus sp. MMO-58]|uniref:hypothetical protein n=1 Tax=Paenibacillus sp. MMO-58 TaxID=3081290 RepID=UPI0030164761